MIRAANSSNCTNDATFKTALLFSKNILLPKYVILSISFLAISGHPLFSIVPFTVGQRSSISATPSPSESGQPFKLAGPAASGQRSTSSGIPSLSLSNGQPEASTLVPRGVSGHLSLISATPSLSESGQPFNDAFPETSGQASK